MAWVLYGLVTLFYPQFKTAGVLKASAAAWIAAGPACMSRPAGGEWWSLHLVPGRDFGSSWLLEFSGPSGSSHLLVLRTLCPAQWSPAEGAKVGAEIHLAMSPVAEWLWQPGIREPFPNMSAPMGTLFSNHPSRGGTLLCSVQRCRVC